MKNIYFKQACLVRLSAEKFTQLQILAKNLSFHDYCIKIENWITCSSNLAKDAIFLLPNCSFSGLKGYCDFYWKKLINWELLMFYDQEKDNYRLKFSATAVFLPLEIICAVNKSTFNLQSEANKQENYDLPLHHGDLISINNNHFLYFAP